MTPLVDVYSYHFGLITGHLTSPVFFALSLIAAIVFVVVSPYVYGYLEFVKKEKERLEKKRIISNLRVMNDIQTELEEEVKEARIRASLKA